MILPYAKLIKFDELMDLLYFETQFYHSIPLINQIEKKGEYPFRILISTVLSSRTKDEVTAQSSIKLFQKAPNPIRLSKLSEKEIANLIFPVGFYRVKARNIKRISEILLEKYNGSVPSQLDQLLQLPGVGIKTANLVLGVAFETKAITVDTHVHRISNRLGIIKTSVPRETEKDLKKILPEKHWINFNTYLVAHGKTICKPISPLCSKCPIFQYCHRIGVTRSR